MIRLRRPLGDESVGVTTTIGAPPDAVFAIVAGDSPATHASWHSR